jgi:hypothetical protein
MPAFVMTGRLLRRAYAGVLLGLLFGGPLGPLGAWHVASIDPAVSHEATVGTSGSAAGGHSPFCPACHFLIGLRFAAPAWPPSLVPPQVRAAGPAIEAVVQTPRWIASGLASRAPPLH